MCGVLDVLHVFYMCNTGVHTTTLYFHELEVPGICAAFNFHAFRIYKIIKTMPVFVA